MLLAAFRVLPHRAAVRLGSAMGGLAFAFGVRRRVAVQNVLDRLAPAGGRAEAERIARESYRVAGRTFAHLLLADRIDDGTLWRLVPRAPFEALAALRGTGSALFISGHFGAWELAVVALRRCGVPLAALAGEQANRSVDLAIRDIRARAGIRPLSSRSGLRDAIRLLRHGTSLVTLPDQDARSKGVFVEFLGTQASAHVGVASLALRTGAVLAPFALVDEAGRYELSVGPAWRPDAAASTEENERAGAAHFHRFLEEQVRLHPENYFWAHRRWKTRPRAQREGHAA
jgi:KDO2-lipid IV(A) lauroyltransferase